MSLDKSRILILSSNTGGGHRSAALAVKDSLQALRPGQVLVHMAQVLEEAHVITRQCANLYNWLLRDNQALMRYYYAAIEKAKPYQSSMLFGLGRRYGTQLLEKLAPSTLVSVHPMTQHFFADLLKRLNLLDKIPLITVVTDPAAGFWQGWACPEVSRYCVANTQARDQLAAYGIPQSRIAVTGMPIHDRFKPLSSQAEKRQLRLQLGLDPSRFVVLINAGWIGGGNVPQLLKALVENSRDPLQLVFLAGKNPRLYALARQMMARADIPVKVLGFREDMQLWMNAADVMISKPGGLTTFEAMACGLPVIADCLTPPMPQEAGTAELLRQTGAGLLLTDPNEVHEMLRQMIQNPQTYQAQQQAALQLGRPGASTRIAQEILATH